MMNIGEDKNLQSESEKDVTDELPGPNDPPASEVPTDDGATFRTMGMSLELRSNPLFDVHFKVPVDVITFNVEPLSSISVSFDSDRVKNLHVPPARMHFHPAGSEAYSVNRDESGGVLCVLAIDTTLRQAIEAEMEGPAPSLRTTANIDTPHAAILSSSVHRFMLSGAPGGRLVADSFATLAITETLLALKDQQADAAGPRLRRRSLDRLKDYIDAHLNEDIRLADLAAIACLSQHHFSRAFKASTGKSPSVYVLEQRVERAKQFLVTTDHSVAWIAHACGFSSQSHLTTAFRKLLHTTPARFRKDVGR